MIDIEQSIIENNESMIDINQSKIENNDPMVEYQSINHWKQWINDSNQRISH